MTLGSFVKSVIGGTPLEVAGKILLSAGVALWANLQVIGLAVLGMFFLLLIDTVFGAALAMKRKEAFDMRKFTFGPGRKFLYAVGMLFAAAVSDGMIRVDWLPDDLIFYAVSSLMAIASVLDVARKFDRLRDSKIADYIQRKIDKHLADE